MKASYGKLFNAVALVLIGRKVLKTMRARRQTAEATGTMSRGFGFDQGRARVKEHDLDPVTEASMESFPASDSPSFSPGIT